MVCKVNTELQNHEIKSYLMQSPYFNNKGTIDPERGRDQQRDKENANSVQLYLIQ